MDDAHWRHSSRGLCKDQLGGRERHLEFVISSFVLRRVFGTGEAAAVAVGREKHKRLGCILSIGPDSYDILRFLYFLGLSRTVISAGNH